MTVHSSHRALRAGLGECPDGEQGPAPVHPDELLDRAVERCLLTRAQAELIARTRLEGIPVRVLAEQEGLTAEALGMRRHRAEVRLVRAVRAGLLTS